MGEIEISGYVPGAIGRITGLHGAYYSAHWKFGLYFESKVAREMADFLNRFDAARDGFWLALVDQKIAGGIAVDAILAGDRGAHLRWFIVDPEYQGRGVGSRLISKAVAFCEERDYECVYLWTFAGLDAARHLYEKHGFKMCEAFRGDQWGVTVTEQMFKRDIRPPGA